MQSELGIVVEQHLGVKIVVEKEIRQICSFFFFFSPIHQVLKFDLRHHYELSPELYFMKNCYQRSASLICRESFKKAFCFYVWRLLEACDTCHSRCLYKNAPVSLQNCFSDLVIVQFKHTELYHVTPQISCLPACFLGGGWRCCSSLTHKNSRHLLLFVTSTSLHSAHLCFVLSIAHGEVVLYQQLDLNLDACALVWPVEATGQIFVVPPALICIYLTRQWVTV